MQEVLGNGVYALPEAARLLGVTPRKARAWFKGWPGGEKSLFKSDYGRQFGGEAISFHDFVDAAVAVSMREKHGISLPVIRRLRNTLAKDWGTPHPFAREELYVDPTSQTILKKIANDAGETVLLEVLSQQRAMPDILLPFLEKIKYSQDTRLADSMHLTDRVVLDRQRKYGKPIVEGTGMPTQILFACYTATQSVDQVADWYGVATEDVVAAITFETEFTGIAA